MRCPKCGYVSFDYLERCQKCNADLTGERTRLGLHGFRPDPLSLLELADRQTSAASREKESKGETAAAAKPKEEMDLSFSLDLSAPQRKTGEPSPAQKPFDLEKELELTLDGLEIKINSDQ